MRLRELALALSLMGSAHAADDATAARGRQLFTGEAALPARIVGQDFALPVDASRCINCHAAVSAAAPAAASSALAATQRVGPPLTRALLTEPTRRRGGPPSRYDAASLCALLRTGVDPAYVIVPRTMPRYDISDADCRSLWLHLTAEGARP
jgi:hypothetical protein